MKCTRCNVMDADSNSLCISCSVAINVLNKSDVPSDKELLTSFALVKLVEGCKECGYNDFGYNGGTLIEGELKWYILQVECGNCNAEYDEVLEVRTINGSAKSQPSS